MKKHLFFLFALCLAVLSVQAQTAYDLSKLRTEKLGRGVVALRQSPSEVFVAWRYLSQDDPATGFDVYQKHSMKR